MATLSVDNKFMRSSHQNPIISKDNASLYVVVEEGIPLPIFKSPKFK